MENFSNPTVQRLFQSFIQFKHATWHQHSIMGFKPSEIRVLFCIKKGMQPAAHEMKVSEISKLMHVTSPTVTQLLKGLEANGLIERHIDPSDRRAVGIKLTEKGDMITRKAADAFSSSLHGLMEYLGEEQSAQLAELLFKVSYYYNEKASSVHASHWGGDEEV